MNSRISICITLKNRADLLELKMHQLTCQNYDTKDLEVCITDGKSSDNLFEVLKKWAPQFYQIKYAVSDRSKLPFVIKSNAPVCDYNSQMANQPSFEKIIRTDAEILFTHPDQLNYISSALEDKKVCVCSPAYIADTEDAFTYTPSEPFKFEGGFSTNPGINAFCISVNKSEFLEAGGFDERFALGFAGEDNYFLHYWNHTRKLVFSQFPVFHMWHPSPWNPENLRLRDTITMPLLSRLEQSLEHPNNNNPDWKRPEMLYDERIFK